MDIHVSGREETFQYVQDYLLGQIGNHLAQIMIDVLIGKVVPDGALCHELHRSREFHFASEMLEDYVDGIAEIRKMVARAAGDDSTVYRNSL